jgi:hypothetical protein
MKDNQREAASNVLSFGTPRRLDRPDMLSTSEGLELVRAFTQIDVDGDRKKVIDLAKQLSAGHG